MNEYLMRAYLRSKRNPDLEFERKMRSFLDSNRYNRGGMSRESMKFMDDGFNDTYDYDSYDDINIKRERMFKRMLEEDGNIQDHFSESIARNLVSQLYHTSSGRKYTGEKFDMSKAREVLERYKGIIPSNVSVADVYVAINTQYHDYCELLKAWFGDNIDTKVIESAVNFWFKDDDYKEGNKIYNYFMGA